MITGVWRGRPIGLMLGPNSTIPLQGKQQIILRSEVFFSNHRYYYVVYRKDMICTMTIQCMQLRIMLIGKLY